MLRVLAGTSLLTLAAQLALLVLAWRLYDGFVPDTTFRLLRLVADAVFLVGAGFLFWMFSGVFFRFILCFFFDGICLFIEQKHYPDTRGTTSTGIVDSLILSSRFLLSVVAVNLLFAPFYILFLWFPPVTVILSFLVNSYLLAREYFDLAMSRHYPPPRVLHLWKKWRFRAWQAGMAGTALLAVPVLNLAVPLVTVCVFIHLAQALIARETQETGGRAAAGVPGHV